MKVLRSVSIIAALLVLAGCNTDPSTSVRQPTTIRPNPTPPVAQADGAIYHVATSRPLFEDRRARFVGDTLTVSLVEKTSASKTSNGSNDRTSSMNASIPTPTILGYTPRPGRTIGIPGVNNDTTNSFDTSVRTSGSLKTTNKGSDSNTNAFSGSITVTVIEVLPNGNLMVSGEKQLSINEGTEFVRLSGVVNPVNITAGNVVSSTQIADARIESKAKQSMDTAQIVSMLSRFFIALLPF